MAYANKLGVPFAVLLGEDEIAAGKCSVKDLRSGEQVTVTAEEAAALILQSNAASEAAAVILEK